MGGTDKFQLKVEPSELEGIAGGEIRARLYGRVRAIYRQKEIEFPVKVGMARFMADRQPLHTAGQRYDRQGLYDWTKKRFPGVADSISEEDFHTQPAVPSARGVAESQPRFLPKARPGKHRRQARRSFRRHASVRGGRRPRNGRRMRSDLKLDVPVERLTGITQDAARQVLWNAFDDRFRPEMQQKRGQCTPGSARQRLEKPLVHDGSTAFGCRPTRLRSGRPEDRLQT